MKIMLMSVLNNLKDEDVGLGYISSFLKDEGHQTKLISINLEEFNKEMIEDFAPDLIGISLYYHMLDAVSGIVKECRECIPTVKILLGGYFPSYCYKELLNSSIKPDFVSVGEGEESIANLLRFLEKKEKEETIKNIAYIKNGVTEFEWDEPVITEKMCNLFIDREVLEDNSINCAKILFSRNSMFHYYDVQYRKPDKVIEEILYINGKYGINRFDILDHGLLSVEDALFYLNIFKKVKEKCEVFYYMNTSEVFSLIDKEVVKEMGENGLAGIHVDLTVPGGDAEQLFRSKIENYKAIYDICREEDMALSAYIPFFKYNYTIDNIEQTLELLDYCRIVVESNMEYIEAPLKNTPEYEQIKEDGYLTENDKLIGEIKFADSRVGAFYDIVQYIISKYYDEYLLSKMYQYTIEYRNLIAYYIRIDFDERINKMIAQFKNDVDETVKKWSDERASCYRNMIAEIKKNNDAKAQCEEIFNRCISVSQMEEELSLLEKQRMKIMKRILINFGDKMI